MNQDIMNEDNAYSLDIFYDRVVNRFSYIHKYIIRRFDNKSECLYNEYMTNSKYDLKIWMNVRFGNIKFTNLVKSNEGYSFEIIQKD